MSEVSGTRNPALNFATRAAQAEGSDGGRAVTATEVRALISVAGGSYRASDVQRALVDVAGYAPSTATRMVFPHMTLRDQQRVLRDPSMTMPEKTALLESLPPQRAAALLRQMPVAEQTWILAEMSADQRSDVLARYPVRGGAGSTGLLELFTDNTNPRQATVFSALPHARKMETVHAMPANDVARLMSTLSPGAQRDLARALPDKENAGPGENSFEDVVYFLVRDGLTSRVDRAMAEDPQLGTRYALAWPADKE